MLKSERRRHDRAAVLFSHVRELLDEAEGLPMGSQSRDAALGKAQLALKELLGLEQMTQAAIRNRSIPDPDATR